MNHTLPGACACLLVVAFAPAQSKRAQTEFVRLARSADGAATALQTAIVRYRPPGQGELIVDLVSVVHYADATYFKRLDRELADYDAVLYELVASERDRVPSKRPQPSLDPFQAIARLGQAFLGLESQLQNIDYTRENFVHADLSPRGMLEAARKRGDDGLTLFLGIAADVLREYNRQQRDPPKTLTDTDPFSLLFDAAGGSKLRRRLAEELARSVASGRGLGPTLNTLLISDRNSAAMKVFRRQLTKDRKRIAIFYGAAHMPDFERRLRADFGLRKTTTTWLTAWDLTGSKASGLPGILKSLTDELSRELAKGVQRRAEPRRKRKRVKL